MIPELLSPAGSPEKLKYALAYGADAVYAGIPKFSLRARENPFKNDLLEEAITYTHDKGKKIYVTANILPPNRKIASFKKSLAQHAELGPDAFIMADPGMIQYALKEFPQIPVHLSVQTNTMNWSSVEFWYNIGVKRVILSRELSLEEIQEIHERVPGMELEAFVHGSICIAYSGRCLLSNYFNHRDANQGTCTNSCRWEYTVGRDTDSLVEMEKKQIPAPEITSDSLDGFYVKEEHRPDQKYDISEDDFGTYMFNAKDLCAVELLEEIQKSGVMSFKIEGRTKSEYYAAMVTRSYRKAIDDMVNGEPFNTQNLNDLMALSNRSYTTGFYTRKPREFGENYEDGRSLEWTHKAVGMDCIYDQENGLLTFEAKKSYRKRDNR